MKPPHNRVAAVTIEAAKALIHARLRHHIALQERDQDYLRCYGNTDLAPNAQYYIGWIHYSQADYPSAANDFDAVLEKYPDNNNKMADAFY